MNVIVSAERMHDLHVVSIVLCREEQRVQISGPSRGLEMRVVPKQDNKDLKHDIELGPASSSHSGSS